MAPSTRAITAVPGAAPSLQAYLGIALLLRLPAVWCADGFTYADQQFQYVEPAWHLATGGPWHRTWEWIDGVRSWVYPEFLAGVFRAVRSLGMEDPMSTMRAVRGAHALLSLLPVWLFWLAIVRWHPLRAPRLPLLLFAGSGLLVTTGVQPSGPALGATLAVAAALAVSGPRWFPALGGVCLGLAFCCRFQEALFGPALLAVLLWQRRLRAAALFVAACAPGILLQGLTDLRETGRFLGSALAYVDTNLHQGAAAKWSAKPWWFYLAAAVATLALVPPWFGTAWRRLVAGLRILPASFAAAVLHLGTHSCIARKALRFEFAALTMLLAVIAAGLASHGGAAPESGGGASQAGRWHTRLLVAVHVVMLLVASFWFGNAGAVRCALSLRGDAALAGEVLVVDGDVESLGGFYYLGPQAQRIVGVRREDLAQRLRQATPPAGAIVVAVRDPIDPRTVPDVGRLEPAGVFEGCLGLRKGERRYVYRWR